jgi:hypothetical protein
LCKLFSMAAAFSPAKAASIIASITAAIVLTTLELDECLRWNSQRGRCSSFLPFSYAFGLL